MAISESFAEKPSCCGATLGRVTPQRMGWPLSVLFGIFLVVFSFVGLFTRKPVGICTPSIITGSNKSRHTCENLREKSHAPAWMPTLLGVTFNGRPGECTELKLYPQESEDLCGKEVREALSRYSTDCVLDAERKVCTFYTLCMDEARKSHLIQMSLCAVFGACCFFGGLCGTWNAWCMFARHEVRENERCQSDGDGHCKDKATVATSEMLNIDHTGDNGALDLGITKISGSATFDEGSTVTPTSGDIQMGTTEDA